MSLAMMRPFTTIPVTTTPKQKMGKRYSIILVYFLGLVDGFGQENDANADPEDENAGNPKAYEHAIVPVYEEPEQDARDQADERRRGEKVDRLY